MLTFSDVLRDRRIWPLGVFTALYMLAALAGVIATGNREFVFYLVVMVIIIAVILVVHLRVNLTIPALWALSIWGAAHMAGGLVPVPQSWPIDGDIRVLYSWWIIPERIKYDQVIHAYGFGVTTWVCWQGMRRALAAGGDAPRPTAGLMLLAAAAGLGFGALNEVVEFAATLMVPETNVGGYVNTGWDLVSNSVGATVAALAIYFTGRR